MCIYMMDGGVDLCVGGGETDLEIGIKVVA